MKVFDTTKILYNLKGEEMKDGEETATMGQVVANILCGQGIDNPLRAFQLARKLTTDDKVDLKAEDVVYLKSQLEKSSKFMSSIVLGQVLEELEA